MAKVSFIATASIAICVSQASVDAADLPMGCTRTGLPGDVTGGFFFRCPDGTNYLPDGGSYIPVDRRGRPLPQIETDTTDPEAGSGMQPFEETADQAAESQTGDPEAAPAPETMAPGAETGTMASPEAGGQPTDADLDGPQWSAPGGGSSVRSAEPSTDEQPGPRFQPVPK